MVILGLDMSGEDTSVALDTGERTLEAVHPPRDGRRHRAPIPAINDILEEAGMSLDDVDMVAFGAGPGLFSGIRVACATAQAICHLKGKAIRPVSTTLALACEAGQRKVVCALPAYRGHYFIAIYSKVAQVWSAEIPVGLYPVTDLPRLDEPGWAAIGRGFAADHPEVRRHYARHVSTPIDRAYPSARAIITAAKTHFPKTARLDPLTVTPIYARSKVAFTVEERLRRPRKGNGRA